ncbi:MAG: threonine--tRNA ligase [Rhizobiaceae bacterium]|nr:threonine--tRNA ligase [Rhizobiaceae bacterium]
MAQAITLTFPDGNKREYSSGTTGGEVAESIAKSLAKKSVAYVFDGELHDLADPIDTDGNIELVTRTDDQALDLIRHDAAHVMAEAVQELWPETQVTIGPIIENGFYYDFARNEPFKPEDLPVIEKKMREIIARNAPFTKEVWSRDDARAHFEKMGEDYKVELVDAIPEGESLKIYKQGEWMDLCRGPHMRSTGDVGSAFKLMSVAGAYWRGDAKNAMLSRIYGTAWADAKQLQDYLVMREEAEKRDHRKLGREMGLFHFQEEGPGVVFWHAKGWKMFQKLVNYMRRRLEGVYEEVNTPQILDKALWEQSGHWGWYRENMFTTVTEDDREFAIKPMNCPGHIKIYKHGLKSYRDLPVRMAEFGTVHRYEPSGALHGLLRVRAFTQDDAHVFCTEDHLEAECLRINDLMMSVYKDFGFSEVLVKLATRPEKRVGTDAMWDHAEDILRKVLNRMAAESDGRIKIGINEGEGTFYGPKFEYTLKDAIGREWQMGTTQIDFNLPERFGIFYIDADNEKKQPVMIHRAVCGSLERFMGILMENYAGQFPLWLAPVQVVVASITTDANSYVENVVAALKKAGLSAEADIRNEKINYKVREHSLAKVPVILVCGMREAEGVSVNMRRLGSKDQMSYGLEEAVSMLAKEAVPPDLKRS